MRNRHAAIPDLAARPSRHPDRGRSARALSSLRCSPAQAGSAAFPCQPGGVLLQRAQPSTGPVSPLPRAYGGHGGVKPLPRPTLTAGGRYKPLGVGVVLLDLVPAAQLQPDLFEAANQRRQKLSPVINCVSWGNRSRSQHPTLGPVPPVSPQGDHGCVCRARRVAQQNGGLRCRPRRRSTLASAAVKHNQ
jgi:hypothetical protein